MVDDKLFSDRCQVTTVRRHFFHVINGNFHFGLYSTVLYCTVQYCVALCHKSVGDHVLRRLRSR